MADTTTSPPASPAAPVAPAASPAADVLNLRAPALSATSDIPVLTPAPAPADAAAAAPPPASDDAAAGDGEGDGADGKGKDNTPAWQKAEITKERNRRRAAEAKAEAAETARAEADRRLDEALKAIPRPKDESTATPPPPEAPRPKRPVRANFEDPDAFDAALNAHEDALIEWSSRTAATTAAAAAAEAAKKAAADAAAATTDEARKTAEAAQVKAMQTKWEANRTKAIEQLPDYAEVAENPEVQISLAMASVITTRPDGPQIAYHLGKNPELSARIAALTPPEAVFELGLIAAELKTTKPPELTKAPDPVRTVGARAAANRKGPDEMSMDEYAAERNKALRAAAH